MLPSRRYIRHAAHDFKQVRHSSDNHADAEPFLRGSVASLDGHHTPAINYRSPVVGDGAAPARWQAVVV